MFTAVEEIILLFYMTLQNSLYWVNFLYDSYIKRFLLFLGRVKYLNNTIVTIVSVLL